MEVVHGMESGGPVQPLRLAREEHGIGPVGQPIRSAVDVAEQGDASIPGRFSFQGAAASHARIMLTYLWRHRRLPNLDHPTRFTELVQVRKLRDRNRLMPVLADKVLAKDYVAAQLGRDWIVPTLWHGTHLPARPVWEPAFVVKSRHGCNQRAFVRSGQENWDTIRSRSRRWMQGAYGTWLDEWAYSEIERGLLVEPFIGKSDTLPVDFKLFVFGGRVEYVQVHLDREHDHSW